MLINVVGHRCWQEVADGAIVTHTIAYQCGRYFKFGYGKFGNTASGLFRQICNSTQALLVVLTQLLCCAMNTFCKGKSRPVSHHDVCQIEYLFPFMPCVQLQESIPSHQQAQRLCFTQFDAQLSQGIHCVAFSRTFYLAVIQDEGRLVNYRQSYHLAAMQGGYLRCLAMRRIADRNEADLLQSGQFQHFLGQTQVTIVYWIKCTAEDADGLQNYSASLRMSDKTFAR